MQGNVLALINGIIDFEQSITQVDDTSYINDEIDIFENENDSDSSDHSNVESEYGPPQSPGRVQDGVQEGETPASECVNQGEDEMRLLSNDENVVEQFLVTNDIQDTSEFCESVLTEIEKPFVLYGLLDQNSSNDLDLEVFVARVKEVFTKGRAMNFEACIVRKGEDETPEEDTVENKCTIEISEELFVSINKHLRHMRIHMKTFSVTFWRKDFPKLIKYLMTFLRDAENVEKRSKRKGISNCLFSYDTNVMEIILGDGKSVEFNKIQIENMLSQIFSKRDWIFGDFKREELTVMNNLVILILNSMNAFTLNEFELHFQQFTISCQETIEIVLGSCGLDAYESLKIEAYSLVMEHFEACTFLIFAGRQVYELLSTSQ